MCGLLPPLPVPLLHPPLLARLNRLTKDKAWLDAHLLSLPAQAALRGIAALNGDPMTAQTFSSFWVAFMAKKCLF